MCQISWHYSPFADVNGAECEDGAEQRKIWVSAESWQLSEELQLPVKLRGKGNIGLWL